MATTAPVSRASSLGPHIPIGQTMRNRLGKIDHVRRSAFVHMTMLNVVVAGDGGWLPEYGLRVHESPVSPTERPTLTR